jgi:hypothetical protein
VKAPPARRSGLTGWGRHCLPGLDALSILRAGGTFVFPADLARALLDARLAAEGMAEAATRGAGEVSPPWP